MVSKKGIALTIGILSTITIASFVIWFIPQNNQLIFVITDFESHLDGVKEVHNTISQTVEKEFQNLIEEKITPDEYIQIAEISTSQINSQIIQLVESQPTGEWSESYSNYIDSLRQFNSYLRETVVAAKMIGEGTNTDELDKVLEKINEFKEASNSLITASDEARP
jgi:hypothetical protein